jgi:hypothetical protein
VVSALEARCPRYRLPNKIGFSRNLFPAYGFELLARRLRTPLPLFVLLILPRGRLA